MDPDKKTLAELSQEVREKKYVTLDVASELSGYTKDYLDRLCRLDKIDHRLWNKGGFVVELGSLLRATHTLLLSDEEINFVDQRELSGPIQEEVVSPLRPPTIERVSVNTPIAPPTSALPSIPPASPARISPLVFTPPSSAPSPVLAPPLRPVVPPLPPPPAPPSPTAPVSVAYSDEWEALLFDGARALPKEEKDHASPIPSLYETPSAYRPIATSVDPTPHHDDAPLFPSLDKNMPGKVSTSPTAPAASFAPLAIPPSSSPTRADAGGGQAPLLPKVAAPAPLAPRVSSPPAPPPVRVPARVSPSAALVSVSAPLPRVLDERHLAVPESHALTKGVAVHAVIALAVVSSATLIFSILFPSTARTVLAGVPTTFSVAGVGLAFPEMGTISYESESDDPK